MLAHGMPNEGRTEASNSRGIFSGESDQQILDEMARRHGSAILVTSAFRGFNTLLWIVPVTVALIVAGTGFIRRRRARGVGVSGQSTMKCFIVWFGLTATLLLTSCYGGSRPSGIDLPAPDFTLQDRDRAITLSQFRGGGDLEFLG